MRRRLRKWILLLSLLTAAGAAAASLSRAELSNLLGEANTLFRQANDASLRDPAAARDLYRRAALRYERIVQEGGIHNGKLFYNIGNAYFRAGDIGRAILNYRRAQLYIPDDANVAQNLSYARSSRADAFQEKQETQVLKTLLFWHYDLSPRLRSLILVIAWGLFWVAAAIRLLRRSWAPRPLLAATGVVALLFLGSLVAAATGTARRQPGVILAEQVIARKGDGISYEPSFKEPLHAGTEFVLAEARGDWCHIELPDGRRCWIPADSAGLVNQY